MSDTMYRFKKDKPAQLELFKEYEKSKMPKGSLSDIPENFSTTYKGIFKLAWKGDTRYGKAGSLLGYAASITTVELLAAGATWAYTTLLTKYPWAEGIQHNKDLFHMLEDMLRR
jgi:hypothetical protein